MSGFSLSQLFLLIVFVTGIFTQTVAAENEELWIQQHSWESIHGPITYDSHKKLLLAGHEHTTILWDVETGLALRRYPFTGAIRTLKFFGDDAILIASNRVAFIFEKQSGTLRNQTELGDVNDNHFLHVQPDSTVWVISCDRKEMRVWDLLTTEEIQRFAAEGKVHHAVVSPDRKYLLTGGADGVGILWNLNTGKVHQRFRGSTDIRDAVFNKDGTKFLTIGSGESWYTPRVNLWDTETTKLLLSIPRTVSKANFAENAILLIYPDGKHERWQLDRHEAPAPKEEWPTYQYNPRKRYFFTENHWVLHRDSTIQTVTLYNPATEQSAIQIPVQHTFHGTAYHRPLDISHSGRFLLTGASTFRSEDGNAAIWDLEKGEVFHSLNSSESVLFGQFSHDERSVVYGHHTQLNIMDLATKEVMRSFKIQEHEKYSEALFTSLQLSRDGNKLLTSLGEWYNGDGGGILIWDIQSGEIERDYAETSKAVLFAGFNTDETTIIAARSPGNDGSSGIDELGLFDVKSGATTQTKQFEKGWHSAGRIDPSGKRFASVEYHSGSTTHPNATEITQWDLNSLDRVGPPMVGQGPIWNSNGEVTAYLREAGQIHFYNSESGQLLQKNTTTIADGFSARIHPNNASIIGARATHRHDSGKCVTLENILTGATAAELYLFKDSSDWLIKTESGFVNGSPAGLARVSKRRPGLVKVELAPDFVSSATSSSDVRQSLNPKFPTGDSLLTALTNQPQLELPQPPPPTPERKEWYDWSWDRNTEATKYIESSGGSVRKTIHNSITFVHLEGCKASDELLKELRWVGRIDRLYLADTGLTDAQLDHVSILSHLKRMSLWGNPITDRGIKELSDLPQLEVLDIHGTQVTPAGLNQLKTLPKLKTLIVPASINLQDLQPLLNAHPGLEIILRKLRSAVE